MPTQLPSGRWRPRVRQPRTGKHINPQAVIGGPTSYEHEHDARRAEDQARAELQANARLGVTVREWRDEWITNPLWRDGRGESTMVTYIGRTANFAKTYGDRPMRAIDDTVVHEWLGGGANRSTVPILRSMFNDAMTAEAGRVVDRNPWMNLRRRGANGRGRRDVKPPDLVKVAEMIMIADRITPPSFAAYLHVAAFEGMRPGELDGLPRDALDFQRRTIHVRQQWNRHTRKFTLPKYESVRTIAMTAPARERLLELPVESEWAFTTLRGYHYTPSTRSHHWNRVRCTAGLPEYDLYTCTRHFFGWYAWNVLGLDPRDIALHFGHQDGGELVRTLYGQADEDIARERILAAFENAPGLPTPIRKAS
jgi:integrase